MSVDYVYIEVQSIQYDINNNTIILSSYWTPPPETFSGRLPTYINFISNPFQVTSNQSALVTSSILSQVENFFDQFSYAMTQETDPNDPTKKINVLRLTH